MSAAPAPCSEQPGAPARFGDLSAALNLHSRAAAGRALTQQQAAPSPTLGGRESVAWPLWSGKSAEQDAVAAITGIMRYPRRSLPGADHEPGRLTVLLPGRNRRRSCALLASPSRSSHSAPAARPDARILQACKGASSPGDRMTQSRLEVTRARGFTVAEQAASSGETLLPILP